MIGPGLKLVEPALTVISFGAIEPALAGDFDFVFSNYRTSYIYIVHDNNNQFQQVRSHIVY